MEEEVAIVLSLLREDGSTRWVAEQVQRTFSQGLSMSVKEASEDQEFTALEPSGLTTRERRKREKYETTRPYSDDEKRAVIRKALEMLYVELPAIQVAALAGLKDLGIKATAVEFLAPDEPEQDHVEYLLTLDDQISRRASLASKFQEFEKMLSS